MMWNPSHVQILVRSAKDLKIKGNDGTNDAFVTIDLGHSKFQTSVKPGSTNFVEWFELCEMKLPKQSNNQTLTLTAYHKNLLSTDQFLGTVSIPLNRFFDSQNEHKVIKTKVTKCYRLSCKPGQTKTDYRGELEVGITFIMKSECTQSLDEPKLRKLSNDLKHKLSFSTLSLNQNPCEDHLSKEYDQIDHSSKQFGKDDAAVILRKYTTIKRKVTKSNLSLSPEDAESFLDEKSTKEIRERFRALSKDNLIELIIDFHSKNMNSQRRELELEDYIDQLTVKVLEASPEILRLNEKRSEYR